MNDSAEDEEPAARVNPHSTLLSDNNIVVTREGIAKYLRSLAPPDAERRQRAIQARQLIEQLGAKRFQKREQATRQLLQLVEFPREAVEQAMRSPDPEVRWRASQLLDLAQQKLHGRESLNLAVCRTIQHLQIKGLAKPLLAAMPEFTSRHLLATAGDALAATSRPEDVPRLRNQLSGPASLQVAAIQALAAVLEKEAVADLQKLLDHPAAEVRLAAARELANLGERSALPVLGQLLADADLNVRIASVEVLRSVTGQQFRFLPYVDSAERKEPTQRWQQWIAAEGATADLHFPLAPVDVEIGHTVILLYSQSKLIELDAAGKQIREIGDLKFPWAVSRLKNGNLLVGSYRGKFVVEFDANGKQVWRKEGLPGGVFGVQRLENGNTLMACHTKGVVLEVDRAGATVWQVTLGGQAFDVQRLENGNTLVAMGTGKRVVEVDPNGEIVWQIDGLNIPRTAQRLENGNTLVSDYRDNRVVEFDRSGKSVWSYRDVNGPYSAERLSGGRTLISDKQGVRIVDYDGNVVWEQQMQGVGRVIRY